MKGCCFSAGLTASWLPSCCQLSRTACYKHDHALIPTWACVRVCTRAYSLGRALLPNECACCLRYCLRARTLTHCAPLRYALRCFCCSCFSLICCHANPPNQIVTTEIVWQRVCNCLGDSWTIELQLLEDAFSCLHACFCLSCCRMHPPAAVL